jgi:polar amino acid transport system permease protein
MTQALLAGIAEALLTGAYVTIGVALGALAVAITLGLLLASLRFLYPTQAVHVAIATYVEFFRNIPSLTHLFIIYFGLAYLGLRLTSLTAAILGLGLIGGAVLADVFRAGFQAVSAGQREAAMAIGLSPLQAFRLVVLPQAWRISLPPLGNYAIGLVKDTSLVAAIAAPEIMFNARQIVNETFETTLVYGSAALIYLVITLALSRLLAVLERRAAY